MANFRRASRFHAKNSAVAFRRLISGASFLTVSVLASITAQAAPPPRPVSGIDPFAACTADQAPRQPGRLYRDTEIEPWIEVNPANPRNLIAGWQQDRWSDGGARSNVAGVSFDGGASWARIVVPNVSKCSGGIYDRATDPWVAISPNGVAYFMSLSFNNNRPDGGGGANAMLVSRSVNGGFSWSNPISLIIDTDGQIFNDKNSITADPHDSNYVYAVWDRFFDFTLPPSAPVTAKREHVKDGVVRARELRPLLRERAAKGMAAAPSFKAPTVFTRTTNGGKSWEVPKTIYDPGNDGQTIGNLVAVTPNGTVINFFMNIAASGAARIGLQKSFDKGKTFERARLPIAVDLTPSGSHTPDARRLVRDGNTLFDVAVDRGNGNLYLVWQDARFGNMDKVAFSMSKDEGRTWSEPILIAMTPRSPVRLRNQSIVPSIEVGRDHQLTVTYYDFRFDKSDGRELLDYFAVFCTPGPAVDCAKRKNWGDGVTPLKDIKLTRQSFDILDAPFASGHFLGDYMGLTRKGPVMMPAFGVVDGVRKTTIMTTPIRSKAP